MYPERVGTYKHFYDSQERDRGRISMRDDTNDVESIYQQYSSRVCQREPHDDRLRYFHEEYCDTRRLEDDQIDDSSHRE